jgi:hypothetical protein
VFGQRLFQRLDAELRVHGVGRKYRPSGPASGAPQSAVHAPRSTHGFWC